MSTDMARIWCPTCGASWPLCDAHSRDVRSHLAKCLAEHGYDGLYQPGECACETADLMPCSDPEALLPPGECKPGYRNACLDDYGTPSWQIGPDKEPPQ